LTLQGPSGALEALLELPPTAAASGVAVVCHPHPLHGGTLHNKVVYTLARVFLELGLATLRFNYRGVGASAGCYDQGRGELEDALAAVAYARERCPGHLCLAGFSFGAMIALRAAERVHPDCLICVAPPAGRAESDAVSPPPCPWLIVQGEADEVVDPRQVAAFAARFDAPPQLQLLPGVDHFFHGRLRELHAAALDFARGVLEAPAEKAR
jgi:alpha/beta superfamily hydrolase